MPTRTLRTAAALALLLAGTAGAQTRALTADDYARAEKFLNYNTNRLVLHVGRENAVAREFYSRAGYCEAGSNTT